VGEGTSGAKEKIKPGTRRYDACRCELVAEEKQSSWGKRATGRRIPAGTTGDVNQWVIRAVVPQEGESRPCILYNSKRRTERGERKRETEIAEFAYQGKVDPSSMEMPRSRIIYFLTLDENFRS